MFAYQLQMPTTLEPEKMIEEIALDCWQIVNYRCGMNGEIRSKLHDEILHAFKLYLKHYDLCGSSDICEDEMRSVIQKQDRLIDAKIYHLQLPVRLDLFLDLFASLLVNSLPNMDRISMQKVHDDFRFVLRSHLNEYLSINPRCGKTQICQYSKLKVT